MSNSDKSKAKVDRRTFLSQSGAVVATTASVAATATPSQSATTRPQTLTSPAVRSAKHHVTLMTRWGESAFGLSDQAHTLAQTIMSLSDHAIKVTLATTDNIEIEPEKTLLLDIEQNYVSKHPAFAYFAGLPLRRSLDANTLETWLTVGGGQDLWDQLAGEFGDKPLLAGHLGARPGLWSTKPIRTLGDLRNGKAQSLGLGQDVLRAMDVATLDMPSDKISTALKDGTLTAIEFGGAYINHMVGIHKQAKHVATGGLHVNGSTLSLRVNRTLWDRLSPSHQAVLSAASLQSFRTSHAQTQMHTNFMTTNLMRHDQVKFSPLPTEVRATLNKVCETIVAQAAGTDSLAHRIDASYMGYRRMVSQQIPMM
ncbi:MAG: hypothetical protein ACRBCJ_06640 [Hyphomicrobiaceae bacterium]